MFGAGLATLDGSNLDAELLYVASILHDYGLSQVVDGEDFTLRSAGRLQRCADDAGFEPATVEQAADAITVHAGPGITVERDGALGVYVQAGAMLDLAGMRLGDLSRAYRDDVINAHPRAGVTADLRRGSRPRRRPIRRAGWRCCADADCHYCFSSARCGRVDHYRSTSRSRTRSSSVLYR
jgi:hypothetical protein